MDAIIRCPFLSRVPQTFLQQARKTLVSYAVKCPVMMDLASKPLVRSICSSSPLFQKSDDVINTGRRTGKMGLLLFVESKMFNRGLVGCCCCLCVGKMFNQGFVVVCV